MALSPRILVLRALGLGDLLTGVPALRALRRARPEADITLAAPADLEPLVALAGVADRVLDCAGPVVPAWEGPPPEVAVNLHGRGPQSHRALLATDPGMLVAFANARVPHHGPRWRPDEHERERWCRLLEESLDVLADPDDVRLEPPDSPAARPGAVVVHPGASFGSRRWPADRFAAVAAWAVRQGLAVVLTGSEDEAALVRRVAGLAGLGEDAILAGRTDLTRLAAQVAAARLVVCGDTGLAHLASAYGTPSVVLFGPVPPGEWGPPRDGPHVALWRGEGRGDPHAAEVDPALLEIAVSDVVARATELIGRVPEPRPGLRTTQGSA